MEIISKFQATKSGLSRYFTGIPCKHGHISERYVGGGRCIQCSADNRSEYNTEYYAKNKDRLLTKKKESYAANPDHYKQIQKDLRLNKAEHTKELDRARYKRDPDRACEIARASWHAHKETRSIYKHAHYRANKEQALVNLRNYYKANPGKAAANTIKRKRAYKAATPQWYESELVEQLYIKRNELNELYNLTGSEALAVDHIIPLVSETVCGLHCWANLQLLSKSINSSKSNNYCADW